MNASLASCPVGRIAAESLNAVAKTVAKASRLVHRPR